MPPYNLLRHRDIPNIDQLENYRQHGGYEAFHKAVISMQPQEVTDMVKASGLRGRGGAGFPTGMKWSFIDARNWPHYVVANADESEPGTFKDREIMERNPFQFLEGVALCAYAIGANAAYVYLRGEFWQIAANLDAKIAQLQSAGLLGDKLFGTNYSYVSILTWAQERISAAKKQRCWSRSRASWVSLACAHHFHPAMVCLASPRWLIMSKHLPMCP